MSLSPLHGIRADLPELVALRLRAAELAHVERRRSADRSSGPRASPFRGRGMEYAESRPYAPGDDVRHIDWRVTARTGRTHTKLFQPERERITAIVFDAGPAMRFGTRACLKSVQAARLAALMAWAALAEGDRLAAAACGRAREVVAPTGTRRGALRVLDALVRWQEASPAGHAASLADALDALQRVLRPGSHVLLLVDARSVDEAAARAVARLRAHHDVAACVLVDAIELAPPPLGRYRVSDGTRRQVLALDEDEARAAWTRHFALQHGDALARLQRAGAHARIAATHEDPVHVLHALLGRAPAALDPVPDALVAGA